MGVRTVLEGAVAQGGEGVRQQDGRERHAPEEHFLCHRRELGCPQVYRGQPVPEEAAGPEAGKRGREKHFCQVDAALYGVL